MSAADYAMIKKQHLELPTRDDKPIWDVWMSVFHFPTLAVADEIGLFPMLEKAPLTADEVAKNLSLGARATEALLGVLASLGFLVLRKGRFYNTEVSENYLLPESSYYWGGMLHLVRDMPLTYSVLWEALLRNKPIAYADKELWETHEQDPKQAELFTRAMQSQSFPGAMGVAQRGNFTGVQRLLDVGGGSGCFCIALAFRHPEIRFTVMELPVVCKLAEKYIAGYGLQGRIDTLGANMFKDAWPLGYDAVFFSNIFHDWDWNSCRHLSQRSFDVLPRGGRIYLHEMLLADTKDGPLTAMSFSMNMIYFTHGKQFTLRELDELLGECGFEDISVTNTYGYYSLVSGRKP
jgi:hypothetical protein